MGASVMLLPSIRYLKNENKEIELHCLVTSPCLPIWRAIEQIDNSHIHVIDSSSAIQFLISAGKVLWGLRKYKFDLIIDYELFMRISAIFVGVLRSHRRAGFYRYDLEGLQRGEYYESRCAYNQNAHISKNYLALTKTAYKSYDETPNLKQAIAISELEVQPNLPRPQGEELLNILPFSGPYIILCPDVGATLAMRNYPPRLYAQAMNELLKKYPQYHLALIGTQENRAVAKVVLDSISSHLRARCVDLCGKTTFDDLLKVIAGASLLITNDNGPGHFAVLTGTRTLSLFSAESPFIYGPLGKCIVAYNFYHCSPCILAFSHKASFCKDNLCLQTISPVQVVSLAEKILEDRIPVRTINGEIPYLM